MEERKEKSWKDRFTGLLFEEEGSGQVDTDSIPAVDPAGSANQTTQRLSAPHASSEMPSSQPGVSPVCDMALPLTDIYRKAGIQESTFATPEQVLELRTTFSDLPVEVQRLKILKTLASFRVDLSQVVDNTRAKMAAIENYSGIVQGEAQSAIDADGKTIVQLQMQMDECRKRIGEAQKLLDLTTQQCRGETEKLQAVLDFLGVAPPTRAPDAPVRK